MRPAVHASILRNRTVRTRRVRGRPHTFSVSRLLMLVLVGAIMFIPGLALTVIGVQRYGGIDDLPPGQKVMFKGIGPAMCTLGAGLLVGAGVYYCCYGVGEGLGSRHAAPVSHEGSMVSNESRHGKQSSILDHENGNSPGTPDSVDKKRHHHRHHHHHHHHQKQQHVLFNDESVPLASCENLSDINNLSPQATVSITVEEPSDTKPSPSDDASDRLINGDIRASSPESYQS